MKVTFVESIQGKFGPQLKDAEGNYYSFGKFYNGKTDLVGEQDVDVFTSAKGNLYINKVNEASKKSNKANAETQTVSTSTAPSFVSTVKVRDYNAEARGKTRCALLSSPLLPLMVTNPHDVEEIKSKLDVLFSLVFPEG